MELMTEINSFYIRIQKLSLNNMNLLNISSYNKTCLTCFVNLTTSDMMLSHTISPIKLDVDGILVGKNCLNIEFTIRIQGTKFSFTYMKRPLDKP